jgi:hypothetical protein
MTYKDHEQKEGSTKNAGFLELKGKHAIRMG